MNLEIIARKYFSRVYIVKILTEYVLYYQVSLGNMAFETIGDMNDTVKKLKDLNLTLQPNDVLVSVLEIMKNFSNQNKFEKEFEEQLKIKAVMHALNDFATNDKELLNIDKFTQFKSIAINNGTFFNTKMKMQYLSEYKSMHNYYNNLITEEYSLLIRDALSTVQ